MVKQCKTLEEFIDQAKQRGENSVQALPLDELRVSELIQKGSFIQRIRDKQKPNCKAGCVENYDIISWS